MLNSLQHIHRVWHQRGSLTDANIQGAMQHGQKFAQCWALPQWHPTPWVHWLCVHSGHMLRLHRTLYKYSSVPTEQRHKGFKRDLLHCFRGAASTSPATMPTGLLHLQEMYALDIGLLLTLADRWTGEPHLFWRKRQPSL